MTPCMVRLAISAAHSSWSRYSEVNGSASKCGPVGASRRSGGNRSRRDGTREPRPASGPSQPSSSPSFQRIAKSVRTAKEVPCDGSPEAISCTSREKSSGPPGVGSAHTSSSRKSPVSSWIRQGRTVCAVFESFMRGPPLTTSLFRSFVPSTSEGAPPGESRDHDEARGSGMAERTRRSGASHTRRDRDDGKSGERGRPEDAGTAAGNVTVVEPAHDHRGSEDREGRRQQVPGDADHLLAGGGPAEPGARQRGHVEAPDDQRVAGDPVEGGGGERHDTGKEQRDIQHNLHTPPYGLSVRYRMVMAVAKPGTRRPRTRSPRPRLSADDWAQAALVALGEGGLSAVAIERLATQLGTTKGSFYWHFPNRRALIDAALARWEQRRTEAVIAGMESEPDPRQRLRRLFGEGMEAAPTDRTE